MTEPLECPLLKARDENDLLRQENQSLRTVLIDLVQAIDLAEDERWDRSNRLYAASVAQRYFAAMQSARDLLEKPCLQQKSSKSPKS